jgi:cytochrome b561
VRQASSTTAESRAQRLPLDWVLAVLIVAALAIGFFGLAPTPNADPQKIDILRLHMAGGMLILVLMGIRFIARMCASRATAGSIVRI